MIDLVDCSKLRLNFVKTKDPEGVANCQSTSTKQSTHALCYVIILSPSLQIFQGT
jgi:hypothetical protein